MKRITLLIFFILTFFAANAQNLIFESFSLDESDLSARTHQVLDANNQPCALVKVGLVVPDAKFEGYIVQTKKQISEYWVYLIDGAQEIEIQASGYQTFNFNFPEPLKKSCTYRLVLKVPQSTAAATPTYQGSSTAYFILETSPKDCEVYIDGEYAGNATDGQFQKRTSLGSTLQYKVSKDLYHSKEGTVSVNDKQTKASVSLAPAFGSINVTSSPSGAKIMLDGKEVGTTPKVLKEIPSGRHTIRVLADKYAPAQKEITVSDNQRSEASFNLSARFANITINSLQGSDIKVDGSSKGKSSAKMQLMEGLYEVETTLQGHRAARQQIEVVAGQDRSYTINPTPIYSSLAVESNPIGATISIDGKNYGTTPNVIDRMLVGSYEVKLSKKGYADFKATARVQENQEVTVSATLKEQTGSENGHEWVDLGLSVKWATCNVGASKPEDYGSYFAWGETTTKTTYYWSTYKWCNGSSTTMTKYCTSSSYGTVDNKTTLDLADDAVRANWGGAWRMPTKAEQDEIRTKCTWSWTSQGGVNGYKVSSKTNGNSIFLPAAGYRSGSLLYRAGSDGNYWLSSLGSDSSDRAYGLYFGSGNVYWYDYNRDLGFSVRGVCP